MKTLSIFTFVIVSLISISFVKTNSPAVDTIAIGKQPRVSMDNSGTLRVVYGSADDIFCVTSTNSGVSFSKPVLVAHVKNMHLGMSRGPQVASSANYSVITAMDKAGAIHCFKLEHKIGKWQSIANVNDKDGSAPEGLMNIAADQKNNFYAVWLDTRMGGNNQVYFSALAANTSRWGKNVMAYRSPDGHVCECCKPNIAVNGTKVVLMFRNWLSGSRDLYITKSLNAGREFSPAQKLGVGTWKLNACIMDGGGVVIGQKKGIYTTWQRKGNVYYAPAGQPETLIAAGRECDIAGSDDNRIITYQNNDTVKLVSLKSGQTTAIGKGAFLQAVVLPDKRIFCIWEQGAGLKYRLL